MTHFMCSAAGAARVIVTPLFVLGSSKTSTVLSAVKLGLPGAWSYSHRVTPLIHARSTIPHDARYARPRARRNTERTDPIFPMGPVRSVRQVGT